MTAKTSFQLLTMGTGHPELKLWISGGFGAKVGGGEDNFVILARFGVFSAPFVPLLGPLATFLEWGGRVFVLFLRRFY